MQAGRLDRRITLQQRVLTRNTQREEVVNYADLGEVWAQKVDMGGREYFAAQQTKAEKTTRFRIRYRPDIVSIHRVVYDGVAYDVNAHSEIGRREGFELFTTATA
jgi:phage head-tail adaptor, putative, SPP1 family